MISLLVVQGKGTNKVCCGRVNLAKIAGPIGPYRTIQAHIGPGMLSCKTVYAILLYHLWILYMVRIEFSPFNVSNGHYSTVETTDKRPSKSTVKSTPTTKTSPTLSMKYIQPL